MSRTVTMAKNSTDKGLGERVRVGLTAEKKGASMRCCAAPRLQANCTRRLFGNALVSLVSPHWHETALVNSVAGDLADADTTSPAFRHDPLTLCLSPPAASTQTSKRKAKSSSLKRVGEGKARTSRRPAAGPSLPTRLHLVKIELAENSERRAG
ncbi:uncharacterized protein CCOS01_05195 [Colletotrichum costaricense]|uniref:Uncharacterized protein n=1 Tax=Colletotrichum costaricense TaxID=1209916 RepID=A0AAI9Z166_9PEZI|nr:uncharacterized protein CCOS01_05195 [Colletotrichum costaricense]KAK1530092.1 hypothetical protein CCOS01_05195 [Colletotrichum costaricense]